MDQPVEATAKKVSVEKITNLVFEGGGVKGVAYVGACQRLEEAGLKTSQLENIGGTSAGAINAMLISVGCSAEETLKLMNALDFKQLLDQDTVSTEALLNLKSSQGFGFFAGLMSNSADSTSSKVSSALQASFGIFYGEFFRKWAENVIKNKTGVDYLTFGELHELRKNNPDFYKDLHVIAANVNTQQAEIFSWKETPNVIISDAVRCSMSIPFVFNPHQIYIKENGKRILDQKKSHHLYVDGGVTDNYPLFLFDSYDYLPDSLKGALSHTGGRHANPETLGLKLSNKEKRQFMIGVTSEAPQKNLVSFLTFFKAVLEAIYHKQGSDHLLSKEQWRTIYVDNCGIGTVDFDITEDKQQLLLESGKSAVDEFFGLHTQTLQQKSKYSFS